MTREENRMIDTIRKLLGIKKPKLRHIACVSKKDNSGRYRYHIYIDGKLAKEECTVSGWITSKR